MVKIVIVEDNPELAKLLEDSLKNLNYQTEVFSKLSQVYSYFLRNPETNLIILDLILPDGDGLELLKYIRNSHRYKKVPVIIISAKGEEVDRILGLELGADDYVVKPFSLREVILRIKRLLNQSEQSPSKSIIIGPFLLDKEKKTIFLQHKPLDLTATEYKILSLLLENPYRVFSREEILEYVWKNEREYYSRVLDAYICRLRNKLGEAGKAIQTVRGQGYRLAPP